VWREGIEQFADTLPCCFDGSLGGFSQEQFELGEHLFDRVQVGRVGRQEQEPGSGRADRLADGGTLVAAQIVHDNDIAGRQRRDQELGDIGGEAFAVDRPVEYAGRIDPVVTQRREEGERPPFAERSMGHELCPARRPAPDRRHVRLGPSLVDEDEASGIKPPLILLPLRAATGDRRARLLLGEQAFF
jgi:hypothetical protein